MVNSDQPTTIRCFARCDAFTLIELLVVMAIILVLAGLLLPAIIGGIKKGEVAQARTDVKLIETAVLGYLNEYGKFPGQPRDGTMDHLYTQGDDYRMLIATLRGSTIIGTVQDFLSADGWKNQNPRKKIFLEISEKNVVTNSASGGTDAQLGELADPWGHRYQVKADWAMGGNVSDADGEQVMNHSVAVWSWGPTNTTVSATDTSHIRSWR